MGEEEGGGLINERGLDAQQYFLNPLNRASGSNDPYNHC